jgi:hypothetical protein
MAKDELIDRLIGSVTQLENFHIYTSNENVGASAEYLRDGLDWEIWQKNVNKILSSKITKGMHNMCTINAASAPGLVDYLDWCLEIKKSHGPDRFFFTLNILRFPDFQSCLNLPQNLRDQIADDLRQWLATRDRSLLNDMEISHVERLAQYLSDHNNQYEAQVDRQQMSEDFKNYYQQYDQRRDKNFKSAFPTLKDWYDSL